MVAFSRRKAFILTRLRGLEPLLVLAPEVPCIVQEAEDAQAHPVRNVMLGQRPGIPFEDRGGQHLPRVGKIPRRVGHYPPGVAGRFATLRRLLFQLRPLGLQFQYLLRFRAISLAAEIF
ncbi:hypothetical protein CP49_04600 [Bradyrhizobium valentinum]|uniref:Uncharacterized protein n=1 Tax=Bradyrhizobium valentinum TaxID=1518501 RepID=A0A0R3L2K6_9BRAD|nr:hypothetical protein CP49_04600 [Bradyrhizobium valentinum]